MAANLADLLPGINQEHPNGKFAAERGNSAAAPLFSGINSAAGRFNSAVPRRSGIDSQTIDLP
jgi:hypothetical protein